MALAESSQTASSGSPCMTGRPVHGQPDHSLCQHTENNSILCWLAALSLAY